ncbi:hypothetical protein FA09DRAFT_346642, partial [Tilletiopsis washingtonensis]
GVCSSAQQPRRSQPRAQLQHVAGAARRRRRCDRRRLVQLGRLAAAACVPGASQRRRRFFLFAPAALCLFGTRHFPRRLLLARWLCTRRRRPVQRRACRPSASSLRRRLFVRASRRRAGQDRRALYRVVLAALCHQGRRLSPCRPARACRSGTRRRRQASLAEATAESRAVTARALAQGRNDAGSRQAQRGARAARGGARGERGEGAGGAGRTGAAQGRAGGQGGRRRPQERGRRAGAERHGWARGQGVGRQADEGTDEVGRWTPQTREGRAHGLGDESEASTRGLGKSGRDQFDRVQLCAVA